MSHNISWLASVEVMPNTPYISAFVGGELENVDPLDEELDFDMNALWDIFTHPTDLDHPPPAIQQDPWIFWTEDTLSVNIDTTSDIPHLSPIPLTPPSPVVLDSPQSPTPSEISSVTNPPPPPPKPLNSHPLPR